MKNVDKDPSTFNHHEFKALMMSSTEEASKDFTPKKSPQFLATLIVSTTSFSLGTCIAWTSPSIPDIERKGVFPDFSLDQKSWIASLLMLGGLSAGPFSGYVIDKFGRRLGMIIFSLVMAVGWTLIASGYSVPVMCIGRFLTGLSMGGNGHLSTVYLAEISQEKIRGILTSIAYIEIGLGILYIYILGTFTSWFFLSVTSIFFPVFLIISLYFMPETPTHLLNKGKLKEAGDALVWLRGADNVDQVQTELDSLQANSLKPKGVDEDTKSESLWKALMSKNNIKALSLTLILAMCQQLSGIDTVLFFALTIFETAGSSIDPNLCSIIIGIVIMFAIFINMALIDRAGRRVMMIISELGMALSFFGLATFFYLKKQNGGAVPEGLSWVPLLSLMSFVVMYNLGAGPIPILILGEVLPPKIKGFGCALTTSFTWTMGFTVTKTFGYLIEILDIDGCYFMFGGISLIGLVYCIFFVPETKGLRLDEIQKLYFSNEK